MRICHTARPQAADLIQFFAGDVDVLRVPGFYPAVAAAEIALRFTASKLRGPYDGAPRIDRIGRALFEKQASAQAAADYEANSVGWIDELRDAASPFPLPIDLLRLKLDELWAAGSTLATIEGCRAFCGLIRIFPAGGEAEPHMDVLEWDLPEGHPDGVLAGQFAANIYCQVPRVGGELLIWPRTLTRDDYEAHRRPGSYGLLDTALAGEPTVIRPQVGELIMFNSRRVHAVCASIDESRVAASCFVGHRGAGQSLCLWS